MFLKPKWKSKRVSYNFTVMRKYLYLLAWVSGAAVLTWFNGGCAQIGMPTGGPKDSLAPVIVRTDPAPGATNFTGRTITFQFDEYIELQDEGHGSSDAQQKIRSYTLLADYFAQHL